MKNDQTSYLIKPFYKLLPIPLYYTNSIKPIQTNSMQSKETQKNPLGSHKPIVPNVLNLDPSNHFQLLLQSPYNPPFATTDIILVPFQNETTHPIPLPKAKWTKNRKFTNTHFSQSLFILHSPFHHHWQTQVQLPFNPSFPPFSFLWLPEKSRELSIPRFSLKVKFQSNPSTLYHHSHFLIFIHTHPPFHLPSPFRTSTPS